MPEKTLLAPRAIRTLLGVDPTKQVNAASSPNNNTYIHRYSNAEKTNLLSKLYVRQEQSPQSLPTDGLISYLNPTHNKVAYRANQFNKLRALAPEIEQAAILVSSSILSPNDLRDGEFLFTFDKIGAVAADADISNAIAKIFSDYFNGTLQLGKESYTWLQDILYVEGAKALLILPPAVHTSIRDRTLDDVRNSDRTIYNTKFDFLGISPGTESFTQFSNRRDIAKDDFLFSGRECTWRDYFASDTLGTSNDIKRYMADMVPSMESWGVPVPNVLTPNTNTRTSTLTSNYLPALESMVVNLRTKLENGDMLKISENPELLRFTTMHNTATKSKMRNSLKSRYGINNDSNTFPTESMVTLDVPPDTEHFGHPAIIKLPIESVIPVCIPGAPNEHLGYFIILDENGTPVKANTTNDTLDTGADDSFSQIGALNTANYDALFGDNTWRYISNNADVNSTGNMIFNHILDGYLRTRLTNIYGRNDLTISRFNSISTVLFYRLLERKRTTVVFAYTDLLHYFAFDYHQDGTGYTKTEEISFLVTMRTSFILANIMAMARDAVVHKKITIGSDNANTNLEGMIDMVYNIYHAKRKFDPFNSNPNDIVSNMYSDSVTIEPRNIPGLSEFSVNTENASGNNGASYNNELVEYISNLIATNSNVPPSALNQLSEPEYATTLVTHNLFFAKRIMELQKVYCKQIANFVHAYASYDPILQAAIKRELSSVAKTDIPIDTTTDGAKVIEANKNDYDKFDIDVLVNDIVNNVDVGLPNPNIVMDKARFAEINEYMNVIKDIADQYFNSDLVPDGDQPAKGILPVIKAHYISSCLTKYMTALGSSNVVEPPKYDEIDLDDAMQFIQMLQNQAARVKRQRTGVSNFANDSRDNSTGGGDDFGGGGDFGGGDDFDMNF